MSEFDALTELRNAGHPVDLLSDAQRGVFARLNRTEVQILNRLKHQLDAVSSEVEGQDMKVL